MSSARNEVLRAVEAYLEAFSNSDLTAVASAVHEDIELVVRGKRMAANRAQMLDLVARTWRQYAMGKPIHGPFIVDGNRVAFELRRIVEGKEEFFCDFMTIEDGKVRKLTVYGPAPTAD